MTYVIISTIIYIIEYNQLERLKKTGRKAAVIAGAAALAVSCATSEASTPSTKQTSESAGFLNHSTDIQFMDPTIGRDSKWPMHCSGFHDYKIKQGETLSVIVGRHINTTKVPELAIAEAIAQNNDIENRDNVAEGAVIEIPTFCTQADSK